MILKYPLLKDKVRWNKREYHSIPANSLVGSGYFLVGVAEDTFDLYIAFTNETNDELWIEKASKLAPDPIQTSNFVKIGNPEEFNTAHDFFIKQGILDGPKRT
jgi:hypothetical protein